MIVVPHGTETAASEATVQPGALTLVPPSRMIPVELAFSAITQATAFASPCRKRL